MNEVKKPMKTLFRNDPATPEGKYLVMRRDGTVVEWPSFVLGAKDPIAIHALREYGLEVLRVCREEPALAEELGLTDEFGMDVIRTASITWVEYRAEYGTGDPGMGRHRKDDPATIALMRKGHSS